MAVPLLDLRAQHESLRDELQAAVARVFAHQRFILGDEVSRFEAAIAAFVGAEHAVGISNGSDALYLALRALDVGSGDEVITSSYSFFASAGSIVRTGARPVFVDIDPETFNLDGSAAAACVTDRTKAFLPVHLFGRCADLGHLAPADLPIVEDAAQAIGAATASARAGTLGSAGCFSFFPSKNLGGAGDGGMITTNDAELATRLRSLRAHGQRPGARYEHIEVGANFRLDALQAAVLGVKLPHLERWNAARAAHAERYRMLFGQADAAVRLPPTSDEGARDIFNQFVIRVAERDRLRTHLLETGIGCAIYYPRPLHLQPCFASLGGKEGDFPHAERAARENLALPVYPELEPAQIEEVVARVLEVVGRAD